jgi:hypothetical protein
MTSVRDAADTATRGRASSMCSVRAATTLGVMFPCPWAGIRVRYTVLTVWFDQDAIAAWEAEQSGKPGGQRKYSDVAIETGLVVRMIYRLGYRQAQGFSSSIVALLGLKIDVPDFSTCCRRAKVLRKKLRTPEGASNQPIHLTIDSTGRPC